jgi:FlaA1/EpsC-like NDP-sugar epimerase
MKKLGYIQSTLTNNFIQSFSSKNLNVAKGISSDIVIVFVSYFAAFSVRVASTPLSYMTAVPFVVFVVTLMVTILYLFGSYHRIWSRSSGHEITLIFNAVSVATLIIVFVALIIQSRPVPLSVIIVANALATSGFIAVRYRSRLITGASWRWKAIWNQEFPDKTNETCVLIVGAGESGQTLAWRLKHRFPGHRYRVVGFVDDDVQNSICTSKAARCWVPAVILWPSLNARKSI